jgi:lipoyl(octanoyl) transferase
MLGDSTVARLHVRRLGRRGYADACAMQEHAARAVAAGGRDELLFVEHPPLITTGRGTTPGEVLATADELARLGISVSETDRGGGATFHGPGQIVGYPVVDLRRRGIGVRQYLRGIETALIVALQAAGVASERRPGLTGVWTAAGKIASIGVAVRRGITRHGFALNVCPDLDAFAHIVPCGLRLPVTSMRELGWRGSPATLPGTIARALEQALAPSGVETFDFRGHGKPALFAEQRTMARERGGAGA